jgi:hypothetical protein
MPSQVTTLSLAPLCLNLSQAAHRSHKNRSHICSRKYQPRRAQQGQLRNQWCVHTTACSALWNSHLVTRRASSTFRPYLHRRQSSLPMCVSEGSKKATRGGCEWEPIKILRRNLTYIPEST